MRSTFDDISSAVPFRRFLWIGLIATRGKVERVPKRHRQADVERKRQLVGNYPVAGRRHRREIGSHGEHVVIGHFGIGGIRHRRVEPRAIVASAVTQRRHEFVIGHIANTGLPVRRDVRRDELAKGRLQRQPACEGLTARRGMTGGAIAEHR
jgi:hypothetical protein